MTDERQAWQNTIIKGLRNLIEHVNSNSELNEKHPDIKSDDGHVFLRDLIDVLDRKAGDPPLTANEHKDLYELCGLLMWIRKKPGDNIL